MSKSKIAICLSVIVIIGFTLISLFLPEAVSAYPYDISGIVHTGANGVVGGGEYRTFTGQVTAHGDYADTIGTNGQLAISKYYANLATGQIGAYSYARSDYDRYAYSAFAATNIQMHDTLNFHVPAGTYPFGLSVTLHGSISGFFASSGQAGEMGRFQVIFGSGPGGTYDLADYLNWGSYNATVNDNFILTTTILTPSPNPRPALTVSESLILTLSAGRPLGADALRTTDYGEATADFYNTIQISSIVIPAGVTWDSDSGAFLTQTAIPEPTSILLLGSGLLGLWGARKKLKK